MKKKLLMFMLVGNLCSLVAMEQPHKKEHIDVCISMAWFVCGLVDSAIEQASARSESTATFSSFDQDSMSPLFELKDDKKVESPKESTPERILVALESFYENPFDFSDSGSMPSSPEAVSSEKGVSRAKCFFGIKPAVSRYSGKRPFMIAPLSPSISPARIECTQCHKLISSGKWASHLRKVHGKKRIFKGKRNSK